MVIGCHSVRGILGRFYNVRVPNITPAGKSVADWSAADIVYYLESGFTPDFDAVGGSMVAVQENMAMLTAEDREAIAAYLKAVPAIE